jgi:hypothetical protein
MAVFGGDGFTMDPSFYGGDTSGGSGYVDPFANPAGSANPFGDSGGGAMPGTGASPGGLSSGFDPFGDLAGAISSVATGGAMTDPFAAAGAPDQSRLSLFYPAGCAQKGTHLNKSTYVRRGHWWQQIVPQVVKKGTVCVKNRRRNAGNARAVRHALGRLAMFDNLARRVEGEMARVARRHHRPARVACAPHRTARGHRPGCRCFACRR